VWRTLIVEDNVAFRQTLKNLLFSRFPFMHFEEAKDGEEAIEKINALHPDLVFMDIKLPGESGLEVTRRIRASEFQGPIVIMTNYDFQEYREAAKSCGADYFVSKGSSTVEEILSLVDSILLKLVEGRS